jgi:hypothetical protein
MEKDPSFQRFISPIGVIANVDSVPPESNHIPNAKTLGQHTQTWIECFGVQITQCYVKNILIDFASNALHVDHSPIQKKCERMRTQPEP